ncbi:hypothetical protein A9G35_03765 [Gilliamella sp. Choc5-1]|nr:hypothetical protein A9G35_03765 [Gilliamella apicola]
MITEEEWSNLAAGNVIYCVYELWDIVSVTKVNILKITKAQITFKSDIQHSCTNVYNKSNSHCLFTNEICAIKYAIILSSQKQKKLHREIDRIEISKQSFIQRCKQLE